MSVSISIKIPEEILRKRGISDGGAVQKKLDADVLSYCAEFVPKKTGALIASGRSATQIGSGKICYGAPYARYQYYGVSKRGKKLTYRGGGRRGSYWFERMKATARYSLLKNAALLSGAKATEKTVPKDTSARLRQLYSPLTKYANIFKTRIKK